MATLFGVKGIINDMAILMYEVVGNTTSCLLVILGILRRVLFFLKFFSSREVFLYLLITRSQAYMSRTGWSNKFKKLKTTLLDFVSFGT